MGDLSRLKGTQSNTLCSGFGSKNPLLGGFDSFFHWYLQESENIMKSTQKVTHPDLIKFSLDISDCDNLNPI